MSDPDKNYASLARVLNTAHDQAASGKGHARHVVKDEPFEEQLICFLQRRGYDGCRFQAVKKTDESLRMDPEAAIRELLGAINYLAAAIIVLEEQRDKNDKSERHKALVEADAMQLSQILIKVYSMLPLAGVLTEYANELRMPGDVAKIKTFTGSINLTLDRGFEVDATDSLHGIAAGISDKILDAEGGKSWKAFAMGCRSIGNGKLEVFYGIVPSKE